MATVELEVSEEATARERAFIGLALAGDNAQRAAEQLGMPASTLRDWRREHRPEYERVRKELAPKLEATVVAEMYAFVIEAGRVKRLALEATAQAIEDGEIRGKDLPSALKSISIAEAVAVDKILVLSGRPTSVVEHRSAQEIVAELARRGAIVDATAVELPAPEESA